MNINRKGLAIGPLGFGHIFDFERYILLALILWLPLKEWAPVSNMSGGYRGYVAPILVIILTVLLAAKRGFRVNFGKIEKAFVLFLCFALLSAGLSIAVYGQLVPILKDGAVLVELFLLYLLGNNLTKKDLDFVVKWGIIEALIISLFGIWQFWTKVPINELWIIPGETLRSRAFATFLSPNGLASYLSLWFWLTAWYGYKKNKLWLLAVPFILLATYFTYSRSALLGLFVGLIILLLMNIKRITWKSYAVLAVIGSGSLLFFGKRLLNAFSSKYIYYSDEAGRSWALKNVLHILPNHVFFGVGPGMYGGETAVKAPSSVYLEGIQHGFVSTYLTDNQYLQILIQQGVLGFLAYLYLLWEITKKLFVSARNELYLGSAILAAWASYSVQGVFENIWFIQATATIIWLLVGFCAEVEK